MERGSNKHSARVDERLSGEVRGVVQGTAGGRAEEWKQAEPSGEDQPQTSLVPEADGTTAAEALSRFGSYIGLSALPGDRDALLRSARDLLAPDDVLAALDRLPPDATYRTVTEIWDAVGRTTD